MALTHTRTHTNYWDHEEVDEKIGGADPKRWHPSMQDGAARLSGVAPLRNGTARGRAVVMLVIELSDGTQVVAQTTMALWRVATKIIEAGPIAAEEPLDP